MFNLWDGTLYVKNNFYICWKLSDIKQRAAFQKCIHWIEIAFHKNTERWEMSIKREQLSKTISIEPFLFYRAIVQTQAACCRSRPSLMLTYVFHNGLGHPVHHLSTFLWWSCQQRWGNEREDYWTLQTIVNMARFREKFPTSNFPITESSENLLATILLLLGLLVFVNSAVKAVLMVRKQ